MGERTEADLLYGVPAIARYLGMRDRQVRGLIDAEGNGFPTFKIGGRICARPSSLAVWIAECEVAAKVRAAGPPDE